MRLLLTGALVSTLALGIGLALYFFLVQDSMIFFPRPAPGPAPSDVEPIRYETAEGEQFAYWIEPQRGGLSDAGPIWIVLGGNATLALDWVPLLAPLRAARPNASFLLIDYPGYGRNSGRPSRHSINETVWAARRALAVRLAIADSELDRRGSILAHSLGCAPALELAAVTGAGEIVLCSPFTSLLEMARRSVGWPLCFVLRHRFDNRAALARLSGRVDRPKITIFHGSADSVIPVEMSRQLVESYAGPIRLVEISGAAHGDIVGPAIDELIRTAARGELQPTS